MKVITTTLLSITLAASAFSQTSFADEARLKSLENVSTIQQVRIEQLRKALIPVGSIQQSMLNEEQFQNEMGSKDWVLMDGQKVTGSRYSEITGKDSVPDAKGLFLRMTGGRAAGVGVVQGFATSDKGLSAYTDTYHRHEQMQALQGVGNSGGSAQQGVATRDVDNIGNQYFMQPYTGYAGNRKNPVVISGDDETRPVNMAVYFYIKVN